MVVRPSASPTRLVRAGGGDGQGPGHAAGRHRPGHRHSRGRSQQQLLAPFCAPGVVFDFRLPGSSRSAPRGTSSAWPAGQGWVIFRDAARPDDLIFHVDYLGGDMPVFQINFSRPAGQIVASYYNFLRLGHEGCSTSTRRIMTSASTSPPRSSSWARSSCCVTATRTPGCRPSPGGSAGGRGPRLHAVRPGRPAAHPRLAGARLHPHRRRFRHRRTAHPGAPGRRPDMAALLLDDFPGLGSSLQQASSHRVHDQTGVRRVQPPVGSSGTARARGKENARPVARSFPWSPPCAATAAADNHIVYIPVGGGLGGGRIPPSMIIV